MSSIFSFYRNKLAQVTAAVASSGVMPCKGIGKFLGLFCLCCLLVIGCNRSDRPVTPANSSSSASSNRITLGTTSNVRTLDPADAFEIFSGNLLYNLGDRLYGYEPGTTDLKPQLATELPKVSGDGLVYRIPLRKGVLFHDGAPFNAQAMAFSLNRFITNGGQPAFLLADTVKSVQATGDYEITIQLKKPFAAFPALLAFSGLCAVSPKAYETGAGKFKPSTFVGTGPYKLAAYGSDSLRLDAFDKYWGKKSANQGVDIQIFSSSANLFNNFRTSAVDVAYQFLDPDQIKTLADRAQKGDWQAIAGPGNVITYLTLNLKDQPLDRVEVRRAIAAMINRQLLQERVFQGQAEALYSLIPTIFAVNKPVFQVPSADGKPAKIQELLKQAGYSSDKPLKINLWYRSNVASNGLAATTLKASAQKELGDAVQVELSSVESATAYQNLDKGIYPIFMLDWYGDFYDPDNYIQPFLACEQGSAKSGCQKGASQSQGSFFYSERANQLIDQERREQNVAKRQQLFVELQNILAEEVPFIPLWQNKDYAFAQKGVNGLRLEPTQQFPFWTMSKS